MDWVKIGLGCINAARDSLKEISEVVVIEDQINVQTNADIKSHEAILDYLRNENVSCIVYSEEDEDKIEINDGNGEIIFILDPIDNTHLFLRGEISFCSVAIMILINKKPCYSFVGEISTSDVYYCDENSSYKNGKVMEIPAKTPGRDIILGWAPYKFRAERFFNAFMDLSENDYYVYNFGGQLQAVKIISGNYDAYVEVRAETINEFCAALIVQRAGGCVSNLNGKNIKYLPKKKQSLIISRNKKIHQDILNQFIGKNYED